MAEISNLKNEEITKKCSLWRGKKNLKLLSIFLLLSAGLGPCTLVTLYCSSQLDRKPERWLNILTMVFPWCQMCPKVFLESCNICGLYEACNSVLGQEMTHISMSTPTAGSPLRLLSHPWPHLQILASVTAALWAWVSGSCCSNFPFRDNQEKCLWSAKSWFWVFLIRADRGEFISPTHTPKPKRKNKYTKKTTPKNPLNK